MCEVLLKCACVLVQLKAPLFRVKNISLPISPAVSTQFIFILKKLSWRSCWKMNKIAKAIYTALHYKEDIKTLQR